MLDYGDIFGTSRIALVEVKVRRETPLRVLHIAEVSEDWNLE